MACQHCGMTQGEDKLTSQLASLQQTAAFKRLDACEQLGILIMGVYLRSPQLLGSLFGS